MAQRIAAAARGHTLAVVFGGYAFGIIAVHQGVLPLTLALCLAGILAASVWSSAQTAQARGLLLTVSTMTLCGALAAGYAIGRARNPPFHALADRHIVADVIGLERPHPSANGVELRAHIYRIIAPAGAAGASLERTTVLLAAPSDGLGPHVAGELLRVRARVSFPSQARNDGEQPEDDMLADQGVTAIAVVSSHHGVADEGPARGAAAWWARLRAGCAATLESRLPALEASVLEGILWGDRGNLPQTLRQEFSDTGTVHVLTTAGLHLAIMAALVAWALSSLPLPRPARTALIISAAWAYAALAGMHLPTKRAAAMLTAGMLAYENGRGRSVSAVLSAAAFSVTLAHPLVMLSPSFSLSFACVGGIALLGPALERCGLRERPGLPGDAAALLRTSLAVQIALWPLQALYFNAFTPFAVLANLLVVPLTGIVMATGTALVASGLWLPALATPLVNLTWWGLTLLIGAVTRCATLPFAHVDMPPPTHVFLCAYWLALGGFAWAVNRRLDGLRGQAWTLVGGVALLAIIYCTPGIVAAVDPRLHLDAIDVGQADCLLVRAPGMHAMLVDGGGRLERSGAAGAVVAQPIGDRIATRTVMPFLLRHWVMHLDAVVLTHPHGDHAGGLPVILEQERVGALYDSAQLYGGPAYRRALDVVRARHIPWLRAQRGVAFELGPKTNVRVLAPEAPLLAGTASDINNNSVVLRVQYGKVAMLLTGDAQAEAEARMLAHGGLDLHADVWLCTQKILADRVIVTAAYFLWRELIYCDSSLFIVTAAYFL